MSYQSSSPSSYTFSTPEGRDLCKKILAASPWPHEPHDYQLEGVCKSLDRVDLLAISPTGSGKSGYMVMFMLVYMAIARAPSLCPAAGFKVKDPVMFVVCPTKALEYDMVRQSYRCIVCLVYLCFSRSPSSRLMGFLRW